MRVWTTVHSFTDAVVRLAQSIERLATAITELARVMRVRS